MERYKNWMTYTFDGIPDSAKSNRRSFLDLHFNVPDDIVPMSYYDALKLNATIMRDSFSEPFDVLLSGGIDSEVMVRTFKDLGIEKKDIISIFITEGILPKNFLSLDKDPNQLPRLKHEVKSL